MSGNDHDQRTIALDVNPSTQRHIVQSTRGESEWLLLKRKFNT